MSRPATFGGRRVTHLPRKNSKDLNSKGSHIQSQIICRSDGLSRKQWKRTFGVKFSVNTILGDSRLQPRWWTNCIAHVTSRLKRRTVSLSKTVLSSRRSVRKKQRSTGSSTSPRFKGSVLDSGCSYKKRGKKRYPPHLCRLTPDVGALRNSSISGFFETDPTQSN